MAISDKTRTVLQRTLVRDVDDLYPDRVATTASDGTWPIRQVSTSTYRYGDEVPTTTKDMHELFMWEHGDEVKGTQAKKHIGMKNYQRDINKAFGKEDKYKDIYVDTYTEDNLVSKQLEKLK